MNLEGLYAPFSEIEKAERKCISNMSSLVKSVYESCMERDVSLKPILNTIKYEGKNEGQYGYYHNQDIGDLYLIIQRTGAVSFCDLGSGAGLLLATLERLRFGLYFSYSPYVTLGGFEIEKKLLDFSKKICWTKNLYLQDITTISEKKIKPYEILYFWEPLASRKLAEKFVKNLEKVCTKGQLIVYRRAGVIGEYLFASKRFKKEQYFGSYEIYTVT